MFASNRLSIGPYLAFSLLVLILASGCSEDVAEPDVTEPAETYSISARLIREHFSDGTFKDEFWLWVDGGKMGSITALSFGGQVDGDPEPEVFEEQDGFEFQINPGPDISLFSAGQLVTAELLGQAGGLKAKILFDTPAVDVVILSPPHEGPVSHEGVDVQWRSDGEGTALIRVENLADESDWESAVQNDGSYHISSTSLAGFPKGAHVITVQCESSDIMTSVGLGAGSVTHLMSGSVEVLLGN